MLETNESLDFFISEMKKKAKADKKKQPKTYGKLHTKKWSSFCLLLPLFLVVTPYFSAILES